MKSSVGFSSPHNTRYVERIVQLAIYSEAHLYFLASFFSLIDVQKQFGGNKPGTGCQLADDGSN
jgi:hypothetical protein